MKCKKCNEWISATFEDVEYDELPGLKKVNVQSVKAGMCLECFEAVQGTKQGGR